MNKELVRIDENDEERRRIMSLSPKEWLMEQFFDYLSSDIKDYLVSIGFNKSLLDKDFIGKIIKKKISKKELLELLSEDEINHINTMVENHWIPPSWKTIYK